MFATGDISALGSMRTVQKGDSFVHQGWDICTKLRQKLGQLDAIFRSVC